MEKKAIATETLVKMALGILVLIVLIFMFANPAKTFGFATKSSCSCDQMEKIANEECGSGNKIVFATLKEQCGEKEEGAVVRCCLPE